MSATAETKPEIDSPYELTPEQVAQFRRDGFIKLKSVFSGDDLAYYRNAITGSVLKFNANTAPMEERSTYGKAFIQIGNLWQKDEKAKEFIFGKRLARIAAELMGTSGVRMYHDQALYKEPSGGFTPWHADQQYWPLATEKTVTAWVPLHAVPMEMGPLAFAAASQHCEDGRVFAIGDESEVALQAMMSEQGFRYVEEPFELGEVSFHYGWTYHRAGGNSTSNPREIQTVIYMDEDMRLKEPENGNQENDRKAWLPGIEVGDICDTPLTPVIYSSRA